MRGFCADIDIMQVDIDVRGSPQWKRAKYKAHCLNYMGMGNYLFDLCGASATNVSKRYYDSANPRRLCVLLLGQAASRLGCVRALVTTSASENQQQQQSSIPLTHASQHSQQMKHAQLQLGQQFYHHGKGWLFLTYRSTAKKVSRGENGPIRNSQSRSMYIQISPPPRMVRREVLGS